EPLVHDVRAELLDRPAVVGAGILAGHEGAGPGAIVGVAREAVAGPRGVDSALDPGLAGEALAGVGDLAPRLVAIAPAGKAIPTTRDCTSRVGRLAHPLSLSRLLTRFGRSDRRDADRWRPGRAAAPGARPVRPRG